MPGILQRLKEDPLRMVRSERIERRAAVSAAKVENAAAKEAAKKAPSEAEANEDRREHDAHTRKMHFSMLWVHWLVMALGLWLATAPSVFGTFDQTEFSTAVERVTADRGLWSAATRSWLTAWNDVFTGLAIMVFAGLSLRPGNGWAQWANAALGVWLLAAPLVFWTPDATVYANDTPDRARACIALTNPDPH